jgi:hypothetical protein
MVHNPNSRNSDKNDDSDICKECKEYYYVKKGECDWIKCSFCEKWLLENCTIFSQTCIDCGRNNSSKNLKKTYEIYKEVRRSLIVIQNRLFYLITIFTAVYYFVLHYYVEHHSPRICQRRPIADLCNLYCCR